MKNTPEPRITMSDLNAAWDRARQAAEITTYPREMPPGAKTIEGYANEQDIPITTAQTQLERMVRVGAIIKGKVLWPTERGQMRPKVVYYPPPSDSGPAPKRKGHAAK